MAPLAQHIEGGGVGVGGDLDMSGGVLAGRDVIQHITYPEAPRRRACPTAPPPPPHFTGREEQLAELIRLLREGQAVALTAVQGMGGLGKTALAQKLAQVACVECDFTAVLWADVTRNPNPSRVLRAWAAHADPALHRPDVPLPDDAIIRALLTGLIAELCPGRVLVILDDVWPNGVEIARRLLLAAPASAFTLATTRYGSVASKLGRPLPIPRLSDAEAHRLLKTLVRDDAPASDAHLKEIAVLLGGHPLALQLAAGGVNRAASRARVKALIERYRRGLREGVPFADLEMDEGESKADSLVVTFQESYDALDATLQAQFRALGAFAPDAPFSEAALAALWGTGAEATQAAADELCFSALLAPTRRDDYPDSGWYEQHALLRAYALALLRREQEEADARTKHLAFYQAQVEEQFGEHSEIGGLLPDLPQYQHAFEWARNDAPDLLLPFVEATWQWLLNANQYDTLRDWLDAAGQIAAARNDARAQANTLQALGDLSLRGADLAGARAYYDRALPLYEAIGARLGQANTLKALGDWHQEQEEWEQALEFYESALTLFAQIQDAYSIAVTRRRMAPTLVALGRVQEAIKGILFARETYLRIGLNHYLELVDQSMRTVRDQIGAAAFDAAWAAVVGGPQPEWLA